MLLQLYKNIKSKFILGLFDNGWNQSLSIFETVGMDLVEDISQTGSLQERVDRFLLFKTSEKYSEESKKSFLRGLFTPNEHGLHVFYEELSQQPDTLVTLQNLFSALDKTECFVGKYAKQNKTLFLRAICTENIYGLSPLKIALNDKLSRSFELLLNMFSSLDVFARTWNKRYFLSEIEENSSAVFKRAAQHIKTYNALNKILQQAGCSKMLWRRLLNGDATTQWTPVMLFIKRELKNPRSNTFEFSWLLRAFRRDGASLTLIQFQTLHDYLEDNSVNTVYFRAIVTFGHRIQKMKKTVSEHRASYPFFNLNEHYSAENSEAEADADANRVNKPS
jgi:hypothetical protein